MLKWMIGLEELSQYVLSSNIIEAWLLVPLAISASIFPALIKLRENQPEQFTRRLQQLFDILFIIALLGVLIVYLIGGPVLDLLLGQSYSGTLPILKIHIIAAVFMFLRTALSRWIVIENVFVFSLITQGLGALTNIILNLILIPQFAGIGAAVATLLAYIMASYLSLIFAAKTRPLFIVMSKAMFVFFRYAKKVTKMVL